MGRAIGGVVAGFVLWTALWLGFNAAAAAALPDIIIAGEPLTHAGVLVAMIGWSAAISVAAGYLCARVKGRSPMRTVWAFAVLQLSIGAFVEYSYWDLMPAWYHVVFLALLVPATVWGGAMGARSAGSGS